MHSSAADIAAFSTGRETILIGPLAAFGATRSRGGVLRNRADVHAALQTFLARQNAEEQIRPWLRRWGFDPGQLQTAFGQTLIELLARAAENGRVGVIVVPEPTMAFAGVAERQEAAVRHLAAQRKTISGPALPVAFEERVLLVLRLVPNHMEGETRIAFEDLVKSIGIGMLATGLVVWIGSHFVPGLNLVVLAFDVFALSGEVIKAMESVAKAFEDIRKAKSSAELDIVAKALAAALAVLIANGVLARFLKAKSITKAVGKRAGPVKKPAPPKNEARKPQRKPERDDGKKTPAATPKLLSRDGFDKKYGSTFKSQPESDAAWRSYRKTGESDAEIAIGRQPDTKAAGELGMTYLDDPNWTPRVNDAFIQGAIDAKKPLYLASPVKAENLYNPPGSEHPTTVFKRELDQLQAAGYRQVGDRMVPPD